MLCEYSAIPAPLRYLRILIPAICEFGQRFEPTKYSKRQWSGGHLRLVRASDQALDSG